LICTNDTTRYHNSANSYDLVVINATRRTHGGFNYSAIGIAR